VAQDSMHDGFEIQEAIRSLLDGCAPERKQELEDLRQTFLPKFQLTSDIYEGNNLMLDAGAYRYIRFNHRMLRAFWLASYIAWEGYVALSESVRDGTKLKLDRFQEMINTFEAMVAAEDPASIPFPSNIPLPGVFPDIEKDVQARACAELASIAAGFAFLHEVHHLQHQQGGTSADPYGPDSSRHDEELSCDSYAAHFLLEKVPEYSKSTNEKLELVYQKRETAIYFALFGITLLAKDKWNDSKTHPAVQRRLDQITSILKPVMSETAFGVAAIAFDCLKRVWPTAPRLI